MENNTSRLSGAVAAAVIAILSGLGIGSGGLLVIWLTMIGGIDAETARGLNLLFFVFSAGAALLIHIIKGRIKLRLVVCLALFACVGTLVGTYVGAMINPLLLKRIFGGMLFFSGAYTLVGNLNKVKRKETVRD